MFRFSYHSINGASSEAMVCTVGKSVRGFLFGMNKKTSFTDIELIENVFLDPCTKYTHKYTFQVFHV